MSTHIEHGTRVRVKTLAELNTLVHAFAQSVETRARRAYHQKAADLAYHILDKAALQPTRETFLDAVRHEYATTPIDDPRPFLETDLRQVVRQIITDHQAAIVRTQERDPAYDWACHLVAIPHRTGVYVLLFAESEEYHRIWRSMPGVEDYAYWNHTDPPDDISEARWERRRQRWTELMPDGIPAHAGIAIDVYNPLIDWECRFWEVAPEYVPDYDARLRRWAFDRVVGEIWEQEDPENRGCNTVFRAERWIKTSEGAMRWNELQEMFRPRLPATWSSLLLHQHVNDIWDSVRV